MNASIPTLDEQSVKLCNACGKTLPLGAYSKNRRMKDGLQTQCKSCMRALQDKWRLLNHEKVRAIAKKSYLKNQDYNKNRARKRYWDNPGYVAQWAKNNKESLKAARQRYYAKNKSKMLQKSKDWDQKNPDKYKERMRRGASARKARLIGVGGILSKGITSKLLKLQNGKCAYCRMILVEHHLDHIMPIALGGQNVDSNIQLLCPPCNRSKGAKHPIDYMQSKGFLL